MPVCTLFVPRQGPREATHVARDGVTSDSVCHAAREITPSSTFSLGLECSFENLRTQVTASVCCPGRVLMLVAFGAVSNENRGADSIKYEAGKGTYQAPCRDKLTSRGR